MQRTSLALIHRPVTLALALALGPAPAAADDLVTAGDPEKILEIARGFGSAELEAEDDGSPRIRARMDGTRYMVYFYGCTDGRDCTNIQLWTYRAAPPDPLAAANDWNKTRRFGNAYIDDDGDLVVNFDVNLWGGVTPQNLDDTFDWWRIVLGRLREAYPEGLPAPPPAEPSGTKTL